MAEIGVLYVIAAAARSLAPACQRRIELTLDIEQKVAEALDDFESLVAEGKPVSEAVDTAAKGAGLRSEVVCARAVKKFGDLATLYERLKVSSERAGRASRIKSAVFNYNLMTFGSPERQTKIAIEPWVERELTIELTPSERDYARGEMQLAFQRSVLRDLDRLMSSAGTDDT